jgi:uncharacterized protein YneF (UPF0154 family)
MLTLLFIVIAFIVGAVVGAFIAGYYIKKTIFSIGNIEIRKIAGKMGVNLNANQIQKVTDTFKKLKKK